MRGLRVYGARVVERQRERKSDSVVRRRNGRDLIIPDFSHVVYRDAQGFCPDTHPVLIVSLGQGGGQGIEVLCDEACVPAAAADTSARARSPSCSPRSTSMPRAAWRAQARVQLLPILSCPAATPLATAGTRTSSQGKG